MDEFPVEEHRPNVNSATIAGEVASVERGPGQTPHLAWLQPGMWIVVHGELTADGAVYGLQVERMAAARRRPA